MFQAIPHFPELASEFPKEKAIRGVNALRYLFSYPPDHTPITGAGGWRESSGYPNSVTGRNNALCPRLAEEGHKTYLLTDSLREDTT